MNSNFNIHTNFCTGKSSALNYVKKAIELNLHSIGFSCLTSLPFTSNKGIKHNEIRSYLNEIDLLKEVFGNQLFINKGFEIDYVPDLHNILIESLQLEKTDYTIGSIHYLKTFEDGERWNICDSFEKFCFALSHLYDNSVEKLIQSYYQHIRFMINHLRPDVVGHLDLIKIHNTGNSFFSEQDQFYKDEIIKTLHCIKDNNTIVEINTQSIYKYNLNDLFPSFWILKKLKQFEIPVTLCSNANNVNELTAGYDEAIPIIRSFGFDSISVLKNGYWKTKRTKDLQYA